MPDLKIITGKEFVYHKAKEHIERPSRIKAIMKTLNELGIEYKKPPKIYEYNIYKLLKLAHSWKYIKIIKKLLNESYKTGETIYVDGDTYISPLTWISIFKSINTIAKSVDDIIENNHHIFAAIRPPGHHAGINGIANSISQGFCIFNNAAIAAIYAKKKGFRNIIILDVDIHHGNGTEDIIRNVKNISYISIHSTKIYPGTGYYSYNNIINYPLEPGTTDKEYIKTLNTVFQHIDNIDPDFIVISLGFDAHKNDPLSTFNITLQPYKKLFEYLSKKDKVLYVLEGGYSLKTLKLGIIELAKIYIL